MKRKMIVIVVLLAALLVMLPALAAPSETGCPSGPEGRHSWLVRYQSPWCTRPGGKKYICRYCSKTEFEQTTPALGHLWGKWKVTKKATCAEQGSQTHICSRCDAVETKAIPTTGHSYSPWTVTTAPTCTAEGEQTHVCSQCGRKETKPVPALGHDWDEGKVTQAPTATEDGVLTYTCKNDPGHTKTKKIPATGEAAPEEALPALTVSLKWDGSDYSETSSMGSGFASYVNIEVTVTNTGNVPLKIKEPESGSPVLQPGEPCTYQMPVAYFIASGGSVTDSRTFTEDDPLYSAYFVVTKKLYGYDPDGIVSEPLCVSNKASLTVRFGKETETAPSLFISAETDGVLYNEYNYVVDWEDYLLLKVTVTNTGDIPLQIPVPYEPDFVLMPGEKNTFTDYYWVRYMDFSLSDDRMVYTPDNPQYYGYVNVVETVEGYDPYGIIYEPLCVSNAVSMTVRFPRGTEEPGGDQPALSLYKTASEPENGEYFKVGEPVRWGLTVTNTTDAPVMDVTVADKGANVGSFASIAPSESQPCVVPDHVVSEYEAAVVGYVKNVAVATGKDGKGKTGSWPSNEATALTKKPLDEHEDPLGPLYGLNVGVSLMKAEVSSPANGAYYQLNETIQYEIAVKNTGAETLKNLAVVDSLAGFTPIGVLASLAPDEEHTFQYAYTVQEDDVIHPYVVNAAVLTYTFGNGIKGTPRVSTVYSRLNGETPSGFDAELLPREGDCCRLTLNALGGSEARYTLHTCAEHATVLETAAAAAEAGDWTKAAELWRGELERLYGILYNAGDSGVKAAVTVERAMYDAYVGKYAEAAAGAPAGKALAEALRMKCAALCCAAHTMPEKLPASLTGSYGELITPAKYEECARILVALGGGESAVVEHYSEAGVRVLNDVLSLLSGGSDTVAFRCGMVLWQMALDDAVSPVYENADTSARQRIGAWRMTLDCLPSAEQALLELMYPNRAAIVAERLMNLYKDAALAVPLLK